ncbi:hypothetical protein [Amycolatopsis speibonae]|uniref:Protein kinase domain-containing protein n=1 Tax=Amycolatopsis speibonae TaxID=1450224 RepID=A0ABV7PBL5_9PSEU
MRPLDASDAREVGRYRLLAELGRGAMGRVLLASGPDGRLVALKQLLTPLTHDEGFRARFRLEVAASRKVSGAYTAAVVDADPEAATPWLASVFTPGPTLQAAVDLLDSVERELVCPIAVELEDRAVLAHSGGHLETGALELAALAEDVTVYADADTYYASQDDDGPKFAADHFIPSGLFQPADPTPGWTPSARALFAGEVIEVENPVNTVTGMAFHRIRVRAIAAIELDVAVATADLEKSPELGNIVTGTFLLTGRLGLEPTGPAENPSKRRRWFR